MLDTQASTLPNPNPKDESLLEVLSTTVAESVVVVKIWRLPIEVPGEWYFVTRSTTSGSERVVTEYAGDTGWRTRRMAIATMANQVSQITAATLVRF